VGTGAGKVTRGISIPNGSADCVWQFLLVALVPVRGCPGTFDEMPDVEDTEGWTGFAVMLAPDACSEIAVGPVGTPDVPPPQEAPMTVAAISRYSLFSCHM
jgi:hypothetical protein